MKYKIKVKLSNRNSFLCYEAKSLYSWECNMKYEDS